MKVNRVVFESFCAKTEINSTTMKADAFDYYI